MLRRDLSRADRTQPEYDVPRWQRFRMDRRFVADLGRIVAALCRYANHDWDRAESLALPELFWRFEAVQGLLKAEREAMRDGK